MWTPYYQEKLEECRQTLDLGGSFAEVVEDLHDQGMSLPEVTLIISRVYNMPPAEAKILVADQPVWVELVDASGPAWEAVKSVLVRDGQVEEMGNGQVVFRESLVDQSDLVPEPAI